MIFVVLEKIMKNVWFNRKCIYLGMDLKFGCEGGMWFGFNRNGKFGVIINYR